MTYAVFRRVVSGDHPATRFYRLNSTFTNRAEADFFRLEQHALTLDDSNEFQYEYETREEEEQLASISRDNLETISDMISRYHAFVGPPPQAYSPPLPPILSWTDTPPEYFEPLPTEAERLRTRRAIANDQTVGMRRPPPRPVTPFSDPRPFRSPR